MNHLEPLRQLEKEIQREKNPIVKFVLLQQLADGSADEGNLDYAHLIYQQAYRVARKLRNAKLECDVLVDLGSTAEKLNETGLAIDSYQNALKIAQKRQDFIAQSDILDKLGALNLRIGNAELANEYFDLAADAADIAEIQSPINAEESQEDDIASLKITAMELVQKTLEVSNEIKRLKRTRLARLRFAIIVDILLIIVLISIKMVFSSIVPLLVFSFFILFAGASLTYLTFTSSLNPEK